MSTDGVFKASERCEGGRTRFGDIWIFAKFPGRFKWNFVNPFLQDLNGLHIKYWNMIILNPSRFTVEPHSKYWYFCIQVENYFHYASRKTACYFTLDGCAEKPQEMWIGHHIVTSRRLTELVLHRLKRCQSASVVASCSRWKSRFIDENLIAERQTKAKY